jgi:hypothetical protein
MQPQVKVNSKSLYDTDYQLWIDHTVAQLKSGDFSEVDVENLIEEVESLGRSDKRAILSYLIRLCEHFLKLQYWETERKNCFRGWKLEIINFRLQIRLILKDSPSLKSHLHKNFEFAYQNARQLFLNASELDAKVIPEEPGFTLEQALNEDWLPWQPE